MTVTRQISEFHVSGVSLRSVGRYLSLNSLKIATLTNVGQCIAQQKGSPMNIKQLLSMSTIFVFAVMIHVSPVAGDLPGQYMITDLGCEYQPKYNYGLTLSRLNNAGQIISPRYSGGYALWENGNTTVLDFMPRAINDHGDIAFVSLHDNTVGGVLWHDGTIETFTHTSQVDVTDINNAGVVIGYDYDPYTSSFYWTSSGGMVYPDLADPNQLTAYPVYINDSNQVAYLTSDRSASSSIEYGQISLGNLNDLGTIIRKSPTSSSSMIYVAALTDTGHVLGTFIAREEWESDDWFDDLEGGIYTPQQTVNLIDERFGLLDMNESLQIVGGSLPATVWEDGDLAYLNDLIDPAANWNLTFATDINDRGQIFGSGISPDGEKHGYLLTPLLAGDVDRNGTVGLLDLDILGSHFGESGAAWQDGDFNGDGVVDLFDLDAMGANFNQSIFDAPIPEPGGLLLVLVCTLTFANHRMN